MGKRGPKKIPTVLKELHGNPGKRALPVDEPDGVGDLWAPPAWFDDEQRDQWNYAIDHAPPGLLTGTDREVLVVWVVACVEHAKAVAGGPQTWPGREDEGRQRDPKSLPADRESPGANHAEGWGGDGLQPRGQGLARQRRIGFRRWAGSQDPRRE
jgi:hypothetical protein